MALLNHNVNETTSLPHKQTSKFIFDKEYVLLIYLYISSSQNINTEMKFKTLFKVAKL